MFRANGLRKKLASGEPCLGSWLFLGSPITAELLALAGFDALIIDHEHSSGGLETTYHQLRAISQTETTALVRIAENTPALVKQSLDAGAEGLVFARVESAGEARDMVAATRYPPRGIRGIQRTSRAADYGLSWPDYAAAFGEDQLNIALIESECGVTALPEICEVDGIDMIFVGAADLAADIGKMDRPGDAQLQDLIREIEVQALKHGKWLGRVVADTEAANAAFRQGYHFVTYSSDAVLLRDAAVHAVRGVRRGGVSDAA